MLVLLLGDAGGSTVDTGNIAPSTGASGNNPGLPFAARNEAGDAAHEDAGSTDTGNSVGSIDVY